MKEYRYHTLLSRREDGTWIIEFGSYDRSDVIFERECYRDQDYRASNLKIITTSAVQSAIDAAVAELNKGK